MIIYINDDKAYCYIHIPKNSGKIIREKIKDDKKNKIIKQFWGIYKNLDLAHIPFMFKNKYIDNLNITNINYYTYVRNPYNRIISAFFYKHPKSNNTAFKLFVKNNLTKYDFNKKFDKKIIHYYPQYIFICDNNFQLNEEVKFEKLENKEDLNIKEYNLSDYFELETIKIINEIYKIDFEIFNYELKSCVLDE